MKSHTKRDLALIKGAGFLRSFGVGLLGVVLGIYLFRSGLSSIAIGLVIAVGLAGSAVATVVMSLAADRPAVLRKAAALVVASHGRPRFWSLPLAKDDSGIEVQRFGPRRSSEN